MLRMNRNRDTLFNITERLDAKSVNTLRMASKQLQNEVTAVAPESLRAVLNAGVKVSKSGDSYEFGHDIWDVSFTYDNTARTISGLNIERRLIRETMFSRLDDDEGYSIEVERSGAIYYEKLEIQKRPKQWIYGLFKTTLEWIENRIYKFKNTEDILDQFRRRLKLTASEVKNVEPNKDMLLMLSMAKETIKASSDRQDEDDEDNEWASHTHSAEWVLPQVWYISISDKGLNVEFQSEKGIKRLNISSTEQSSDFTNKQTELIFNTIMNKMKELVKDKIKSSKTKTGK